MIRNWKFWVLFVLLVGPIAAYVGLGALWLFQHRWGWYGFAIWSVAAVLFSYLSVRWTRAKARDAVLPPIDWEIPRTFVEFDKQAWKLVEDEADAGDALPMERLTEIDVYLDTGKRLARRLAAHYHPLSTDPIEHVPVVQMLTALELAAEDLGRLSREVPGGDMITPAFWKKAVQAAGFFSKANQIYGYLLPLFTPATGLVRLGTQKLMTEPAWKNMQQNLLRWFYRAYVNRLGIHLIELYSGRLAIGADQYRKLTRKRDARKVEGEETPNLEVAVVGARDSGRSTLIAALELARDADLEAVRGRLEADGFDESLADLLATAEWIEAPGYTIRVGEEAARDRATRRESVEQAVRSDLAILTIDALRDDLGPEERFVKDWDEHFAKNSRLEAPPLVAVLTGADRIANPSADATSREALVRSRVEAVRKKLPTSVLEVIPAGLGGEDRKDADRLLLSLAPLLERAERVAMIRRMQEVSARSKARRLVGQIGRQGKRLFDSLKSARKGRRAS